MPQGVQGHLDPWDLVDSYFSGRVAVEVIFARGTSSFPKSLIGSRMPPNLVYTDRNIWHSTGWELIMWEPEFVELPELELGEVELVDSHRASRVRLESSSRGHLYPGRPASLNQVDTDMAVLDSTGMPRLGRSFSGSSGVELSEFLVFVPESRAQRVRAQPIPPGSSDHA